MRYEEIIPALEEKLGIEGLEPVDGVCSVEIDDMLVTMAKVADGEGFLMSAVVGEPPPESADAFASLLLQANHQFAGVDGTTFSQDPASGSYLLERILPLDLVDADYLYSALGEFVDSVERWKKALVDFRPVLKGARKSDEPPAMHGDFMIV